ncbi:MAG: RHS repeat-associated core domain-containing protein, partial [Comamonas sp.]
SGHIEWAANLDAWGNVKLEHNPKRLYQPIRLPGQHRDNAADIYYNRYRYYDMRSGNYVAQDPIGLNGGVNIYSYVSNPMQWVDFLGLEGWASVPIFNGSLPGNQSTLNQARATIEDLTTCGRCGCAPKSEPFWNENRLQFVADVGLPNTAVGWSDVFSKTSTWAGGIATVTGAVGQAEIAIPLGALALGADATAKYLNPPPPFSAVSDAAIDIIGSAMPAPGGWGVGKDMTLNIYKKVISDEVDRKIPKPTPIKSSDSC